MILRPILLLSLLATAAFADTDFPGLKQVMTPREWEHAGLDQLTPDQIAIVDSALTRHYAHTVTEAAKEATARAVQLERERAARIAADSKETWVDRFGKSNETAGPREETVMSAKVIGWVTANRFMLDNRQVWEGVDYIPYQLTGHKIAILPRPFGEFVLVLDGKSTTIRVRRIE
jgi:hypothetical protein